MGRHTLLPLLMAVLSSGMRLVVREIVLLSTPHPGHSKTLPSNGTQHTPFHRLSHSLGSQTGGDEKEGCSIPELGNTEGARSVLPGSGLSIIAEQGWGGKGGIQSERGWWHLGLVSKNACVCVCVCVICVCVFGGWGRYCMLVRV